MNAIATVLLTVTILAMVVAGVIYRRGQRRAGPTATTAGDAAVSGVAMTAGSADGSTRT